MSSNTPTSRVYGLVPAAGHSRRMGSDKQLLPVHGRPMLEGITTILSQAPLAALAVVTHPVIHRQLHLERLPGVFVVLNEDAESQMIDSIRMGLHALAECDGIGAEDGILVCPGDKPGITLEDVEACIKAFIARPDMIIVAAHHGHRGHPMIFPGSLVHEVHTALCNEGLNQLIKAHEDLIWEVPRHKAILEDIDTPEDYLRLVK
jgi:molybdenum cofactor cytidylyltransferase